MASAATLEDLPVSIADVRAAARRIEGAVVRTPMSLVIGEIKNLVPASGITNRSVGCCVATVLGTARPVGVYSGTHAASAPTAWSAESLAAAAARISNPRVTSAVIGASSVAQLDANLDAVAAPPLTAEELAAIDEHAVDSGVNLWGAQTAE